MRTVVELSKLIDVSVALVRYRMKQLNIIKPIEDHFTDLQIENITNYNYRNRVIVEPPEIIYVVIETLILPSKINYDRDNNTNSN